MILDPETLSHQDQRKIVDWLEANGCEEYIALEPIKVRFGYVTFQAICPLGQPDKAQVDGDRLVTHTRRIRVRTPMPRVHRVR